MKRRGHTECTARGSKGKEGKPTGRTGMQRALQYMGAALALSVQRAEAKPQAQAWSLAPR